MAQRAEPMAWTIGDIRDSSTFADLYRSHRPAVTHLARRLCQNEELAQDVVQEVFLRLWRSPERLDPRRGSARAFLLMECRSRAIDAVRREVARRARQERDQMSAPTATSGWEEHVVKQEGRDSIQQALGRLPTELRIPLALAFYGDLTYTDVARTLNIPEGTAKSRLRRAMHRLARDPVLVAMS